MSVSFYIRFVTLLDYVMGQTLSVRVFWIGDLLLDSSLCQILSWSIPSRRSNIMSNGKGNSVDWDCGD